MNPDAIGGIVILLLSIALLVILVAAAWCVYEDMRTGSKAMEVIVTIGVDHDGRMTGVICPECVAVRFTHAESPVSLAKMAERKEAGHA